MRLPASVVGAIDGLGLPSEARVDLRIAKKSLLENARLAPGDRRVLTDGIEELWWVAKLGPGTAGVAADPVRGYDELQVFGLTLRAQARHARVIELVHRSVAYPLLLLTATPDGLRVSTAHLRPSENDPTRRVVADLLLSEPVVAGAAREVEEGFLTSLALAAVRPAGLGELVEAWAGAIAAYGACRLAGKWTPRLDPVTSGLLRDLRARYDALSEEFEALSRAARREKVLSRRVELNVERRKVDQARAAVLAEIGAVVGK